MERAEAIELSDRFIEAVKNLAAPEIYNKIEEVGLESDDVMIEALFGGVSLGAGLALGVLAAGGVLTPEQFSAWKLERES